MIIARVMIVLGWITIFACFLASSHLSWLVTDAKTISVFCWSDFFDQQKLNEFEEQTGIHVQLNFYETNEELLAKLSMTGGQGYDIIIPTDFAVEMLIKQGLAKKMDRARLSCFDRLHPALLGHYFDPHNEYSIPILWSVYGLGIDRNYFKQMPEPSWRLIFEPEQPYTVIMSEEAHEVVFISSQYLYYSVNNITSEKLARIYELAHAQKKWVEAYNDNRTDYFVGSGICPVAASLSADIIRMARQLKDKSTLDFIVPREGGFVIIDNVLITKSSTKDDLVYQLIDFLYQEEVIDYHVKRFPFMPVTRQSLKVLEEEHILPSFSIEAILKNFNSLSFFKNTVNPMDEHKLWVKIRAQ